MPRPSQYFRAGAGLLIVNAHGQVLAIERAGVPGAWQLPQGGLEDAEEPLDAALREATEETGIPRGAMELLQACPEPLVYELPPELRSEKTGRGQVLYWFLFRFHGIDDAVDVRDGKEARHWRWMPFGAVLDGVTEFRKPMYQRLSREFEAHI
jgi:putative (di)nucleoside polyphosphate hydrolase